VNTLPQLLQAALVRVPIEGIAHPEAGGQKGVPSYPWQMLAPLDPLHDSPSCS
jgi:hypothetical protein